MDLSKPQKFDTLFLPIFVGTQQNLIKTSDPRKKERKERKGKKIFDFLLCFKEFRFNKLEISISEAVTPQFGLDSGVRNPDLLKDS